LLKQVLSFSQLSFEWMFLLLILIIELNNCLLQRMHLIAPFSPSMNAPTK
jgi:hypothetical protein